MIITFATTTRDTRTQEKTYWFTVRIPGYECTSFDIGFNKEGNWISASATFLNLEPELQQKIISETVDMVPKVV